MDATVDNPVNQRIQQEGPAANARAVAQITAAGIMDSEMSMRLNPQLFDFHLRKHVAGRIFIGAALA